VLLFITSCQPSDPDLLVDVETGALLEIGSSSCKVEGEILSVGENGISSHGFVWWDQSDPTLENGWKIDLGDTYSDGIYSYRIRDLHASTTYYVKAFASGDGKVVYGMEKTFTTNEISVPTLITFSVSDFTSTSGYSGGNITDHGGGEVHASGICWSTGRNPDLNDLHTDEGGGHSTFDSFLNDLIPYTIYHVRAYATNDAGTGYGQEVAFKTYWDNSPVTDWDGNEYPTVQIGEKVWTAMNLRSTHYADGTAIDLVEPEDQWGNLETDAMAYCYYANNGSQAEPYGALYTWGAATNGSLEGDGGASMIQGVCPDGWHLPKDDEWKMLEIELGMTGLIANEEQWRGYDEGGKLKFAGTEFWNEPNDLATNESGFNALAAGKRSVQGLFSDKGNYTVFWTSTGIGETEAWIRALHTQRGDIKREPGNRKEGYSVRCIKDI
jgi:uncharacterized protein (TIGR02145 family)